RLARDRHALAALQRRCLDAYRARFTRARTLEGWDAALRAALTPLEGPRAWARAGRQGSGR
ncbi:MAG: hypothetical protein KIT58_20535, partial [Planctomycetota bacterium]|nr:hypothetical protein [Planctomycetota bacterium]